MGEIQFKSDYKENKADRNSFFELAKQTFGIDLASWYRSGFWNDRYVCYSFFENDKLVSNVSVSKMDIVINGQKKRAIQIGTVMTHKDYRGQGFASKLMKRVMKDLIDRHDFIFLFSEERNAGFYEKLGFGRVYETVYSYKIENEPSPPLSHRKVNPFNESDMELIFNIYRENQMKSSIFEVENGEHLLGLYARMAYSNNIYYFEEKEAIVIFQCENEITHVYGVFSKEILDFHEIAGLFGSRGSDIVFHFTPPFQDIELTKQPFINNDYILLVHPKKTYFPKQFSFPFLAHS
ncbi:MULTISPECIES: GNAT family N-acetyltransferase [Bacillaceae]|uniref:GNAT family N-acetyltransferase n=1 Tax=Evansella alkalicola TaxID=745819 RepID=A0ABS6JXD2_9BACI|nr:MULTISPECIES: GNAT family N-acetyltransferase [Bacillaceae]MBU9722887.1 GNAT family N-acetyltransferase [Bacillus alkalicola]